jgi:hypothetical protein
MKLTQEEQDIISEVIDSDLWPVLNKVLEQGVERPRENVLNHHVNTEADVFQLALLKAKLEGAQSLLLYFAGLKKRKKEKNNAHR